MPQKIIRYISITGNKHCTSDGLISDLKFDFIEIIKATRIKERNEDDSGIWLTILAVDWPHIYNIAVNNNIDIDQIENHQEFLESEVEKAFACWWKNNEKALLNLLKTFKHKKNSAIAIEISADLTQIDDRINAFNDLLKKLGITAEIARWNQWLQNTQLNLLEIESKHKQLYQENSEYQEKFNQSIQKFTDIRIEKYKNQQTSFDAEKQKAYEENAWKASLLYLGTEAPFTLEIMAELNYSILRYAGEEPKAFEAVMNFLITTNATIKWENSLDKKINSFSLTINSNLITGKINGLAKKIPDFLKQEDVFIKLLAGCLGNAIFSTLIAQSNSYIDKIIAQINKMIDSDNSTKIKSFTPESNSVKQQLRPAYSSNSTINILGIFQKNNPIDDLKNAFTHLAQSYNKSSPNDLISDHHQKKIAPFNLQDYLKKVSDDILNLCNNHTKINDKKNNTFKKHFSSFIKECETRFLEIIQLNIQHTSNEAVQIEALVICLFNAFKKIYKTFTLNQQIDFLRKLAIELKTFLPQQNISQKFTGLSEIPSETTHNFSIGENKLGKNLNVESFWNPLLTNQLTAQKQNSETQSNTSANFRNFLIISQ